LHEFAGIAGPKILRQPDVENEQRHGDAENSIAERIETRFRKHDGPLGRRPALCFVALRFRLPQAGMPDAQNLPGAGLKYPRPVQKH
jgi:hypothetical protein